MESKHIIYLCGFALAFDFTVVAMSIQSYWNLTGGSPLLYGFAFGCYDLTQFLFIPVFGKISDSVGMKAALTVTLLLNVIGNVIYALAYVAGDYANEGEDRSGEHIAWWMILAGRLIAGCGSAALALGVTFFTVTTTIADRDEAITNYRISQTIARAIATQVPMALTGFPTTIDSTALKIFNFYTMPGWLTAFMSLICLVLVLVFFKTPDGGDNPMFRATKDVSFRGSFVDIKTDKGALWYHVVIFGASGFMTTFAVFAIYSQLFAFGFAKYHLMDNMQDMWLTFIGISVGAVSGIVSFKIGKAKDIRDYVFILAGNVFFIIALLSLLTPSDALEGAFFFVGSGFLGAGLIFFFPMAESFYTKKITQYQHVIPDQMGVYTGIMPACGSLGRFLGPTVGAVLFQVHEDTQGEIGGALCIDGLASQMNFSQAYTDDKFFDDLVDKQKKSHPVVEGCTRCTEAYFRPHADTPGTGSEGEGLYSLLGEPSLCTGLDKICNFDYPAHFFKTGCVLDGDMPLLGLILVLVLNLLMFANYFYKHRYLPGQGARGDLETPLNYGGAE